MSCPVYLYKALGSFCIIPDGVMADPLISPSSVKVWGKLYQHAGKNGFCWVKQSTLAKETALTERTVNTCISELKEQGYIDTVKIPGKRTLYYHFLPHKNIVNDPNYNPVDEKDFPRSFVWFKKQVIEQDGNIAEKFSAATNAVNVSENGDLRHNFEPGKDKDKNTDARQDLSLTMETMAQTSLSMASVGVAASARKLSRGSPSNQINSYGPQQKMTPNGLIPLSGGFAQKYASMSKPTPAKKRRTPPTEVLEIFTYWNNKKELKQINLTQGSEGYQRATTKSWVYIMGLLNGTIFKGTMYEKEGRKFTIEEIKEAIDTFHLVAISKDYLPVRKEPLIKLTFECFVYQPHAHFHKSWFLTCVNKRITPVAKTFLTDDTTPYYEGLKQAFSELVDSRSLTAVEEGKLVWGSKLLYRKVEELQPRLEYFLSHVEVLSPYLWAKWTIESVEDYWHDQEEHEVKPGHLGSDFTYNTCLPKYLNKKGRLMQESKGVNSPPIYDPTGGLYEDVLTQMSTEQVSFGLDEYNKKTPILQDEFSMSEEW